MPEPIVLAIETSQREGGVALQLPDASTSHERLAHHRRHDDDLLPAIDRLCRRAGLEPAALDAIGVSIGPGGFTGLRIAVSVVKMLALALPLRVIAVPTALVVAESCRAQDVSEGPILIALASKRGTIWSSRLVHAHDAWRIDGTPGLREARGVELQGIRAVLGDEHVPEALRERCAATGLPMLEPRFDARGCLAVSLRMLRRGEVVEARALTPLYPREPEAVSIWSRRRGDRAAGEA